MNLHFIEFDDYDEEGGKTTVFINPSTIESLSPGDLVSDVSRSSDILITTVSGEVFDTHMSFEQFVKRLDNAYEAFGENGNGINYKEG